MISFACPVCSENYTAPDISAGKTGKCKKCGELLTVPRPTRPRDERRNPEVTTTATAATEGDGELVHGAGGESPEVSGSSGVVQSSTSERPRRPRAKLVFTLVGGLLAALVGLGLLVYFLTPNPTRDAGRTPSVASGR
jgi:hypothetical protein